MRLESYFAQLGPESLDHVRGGYQPHEHVLFFRAQAAIYKARGMETAARCCNASANMLQRHEAGEL